MKVDPKKDLAVVNSYDEVDLCCKLVWNKKMHRYVLKSVVAEDNFTSRNHTMEYKQLKTWLMKVSEHLKFCDPAEGSRKDLSLVLELRPFVRFEIKGDEVYRLHCNLQYLLGLYPQNLGKSV